jgi:hypothetical protein
MVNVPIFAAPVTVHVQLRLLVNARVEPVADPDVGAVFK